LLYFSRLYLNDCFPCVPTPGLCCPCCPKVTMSENTPSEPFQHQPLDLGVKGAIRLLRILPGKNEQQIQFMLRQTSLTSQPYTCLSYCWGDDRPSNDILIDGKLLFVRKHLLDFLVTARKMKIKDELWIDAICIDQLNLEERNHQVQQMAQIYTGARLVLVYPGSISAGDGRIIRILSKWPWWRWVPSIKSNRLLLIWRILWRLPFAKWPTAKWESSIRALETLPYWQRLWIMQEILLARECKVLISGHLLSRERIAHANTAQSYDALGREGRLQILKSDPFKLQGRDFLTLLQMSMNSGCKVPLDRIYGLLGIIEGHGGQTLAVDYGIDAPRLFLNVLANRNLFQGLASRTGEWTLSFMEPLANALQVDASFVCEVCLPQMPRPRVVLASAPPTTSSLPIEEFRIVLRVRPRNRLDKPRMADREPQCSNYVENWCGNCGISVVRHEGYYSDNSRYRSPRMEVIDSQSACIFWSTVGTRRTIWDSTGVGDSVERSSPQHRPWPSSWKELTEEIKTSTRIMKATKAMGKRETSPEAPF
jgi:hypothetical protein